MAEVKIDSSALAEGVSDCWEVALRLTEALAMIEAMRAYPKYSPDLLAEKTR